MFLTKRDSHSVVGCLPSDSIPSAAATQQNLKAEAGKKHNKGLEVEGFLLCRSDHCSLGFSKREKSVNDLRDGEAEQKSSDSLRRATTRFITSKTLRVSLTL